MEPNEPAASGNPLDVAGTAGPPPPPPPPSPLPLLPTPEPGAQVSVARWVVVVAAVALFVVLLGGTFAAGWVVRGPGGGERAPTAVPTSCSAADILGVVRDWSAAWDRYYAAEAGSAEDDAAYDELDAQEQRLEDTLTRCAK